MSRKEGKEKKKLDTLNLVLGSRVQRRENVGGSLNLWSPQMFSHLVIRFFPSDDSNIVYKKRFVKCFVKKIFSIVFSFGFMHEYLGNRTRCFAQISGIKST